MMDFAKTAILIGLEEVGFKETTMRVVDVEAGEVEAVEAIVTIDTLVEFKSRFASFYTSHIY